MRRALGSCLLVLAAALPAAGQDAFSATYYVDQGHPSASNDHSCTDARNPETPKLTITGAKGGLACAVTPGQKVVVRPGTYAEAIAATDFPTSGSSWTNAIQLVAEPAPNEDVRLAPTGVDHVINISGVTRQYLVIEGFVIDGSNVNRDAVRISSSSANADPHHIRIRDSEVIANTSTAVSGRDQNGIYVVSTYGSAVGSHEFINLRVHGGNSYGIRVQSPNNLIEYCEIYDIVRNGIIVHNGNVAAGGSVPSGQTIRFNIVRDFTRSLASWQSTVAAIGIAVFQGTGHKIHNNLVYDIDRTTGSGGGGSVTPHGIYLGLGAVTSTEVYQNTVAGIPGGGLTIESTVSGTTVRNNISYGNNTNYANSGNQTVASNNLFGVNPLFVDAAADNYQVQEGSPAVDAGTTIASITADLLGVSRPQGNAYDIGAYESGFTVVPEPEPPPTGYYVAKNGNNSTPCNEVSVTKPRQTIAAGLACLTKPGDKLIVRAGTYAEQISSGNFPTSGTSWTNAITVQAFPGETVWLKPSGTDRVLNFVGASRQYIIVDGINLDGTGGIGYDVVKIEETATRRNHHIRIQNARVLVPTDSEKKRQAFLIAAAGITDAIGSNEFLNLHISGGTLTGDGFDHSFYIQSPDNRIENCIIEDQASGGGVQIDNTNNPSTRPHRTIIKNNIIRNFTRAPQHRGWGILVADGDDHVIMNNVIYNIQNTEGDSGGITFFGAGVGDNTQIIGNTIVGNADYGIRLPSNTGSGAIIRNNIALSNGVANFSILQTNTTQSNNLTSGDPKFVNAAGNDYRLQAGSPAIDAGVAFSGWTTDILGVTRPQGAAPDIGAYEYFVSSGEPEPDPEDPCSGDCVGYTSVGGISSAPAFSSTGADLISVWKARIGSPPTAPTDNLGNSYTAGTLYQTPTSNPVYLRHYYRWNPITSSTHVLSNSDQFGCLVAIALRNNPAELIIARTAGGGLGENPESLTVGPVTPASDGQLTVTAIANTIVGAGPATVTSPYVIPLGITVPFVGGGQGNVGCTAAYGRTESADPLSVTWTQTAGQMVAAVDVFGAASDQPAQPPPPPSPVPNIPGSGFPAGLNRLLRID